MMTRIELQNKVNAALRKANCNWDCPVTINPRLTRTLGRAIMTRFCGTIQSVRIEFSKKLLEVATDDCINSVLLHECAHVVANTRTNRDEGHGPVFKAVCHELGTTNDKTTTVVEYKANNPVHFKYEVMCPNCGVVAHYERRSKVITNLGRYKCSICGCSDLTLKTN